MKPIVYIVHCIDTEGPLYESVESIFERLSSVFNLNYEPSLQTLYDLQNKLIDLGGIESQVQRFLDPQRLSTNETWDQIDKMLDKITDTNFRMKCPDSFNCGWVYNWFCMDHVGFDGLNPRRRDAGIHNIFDHYKSYYYHNDIVNDLIQWHYHPLPIIKDFNRSGTTYLNSSNIFEILARKIIDRLWFPAAFRPGFHTERPDSNWFLEQWIPFDYANQSTKIADTDQPDLAAQRFGDWRRAPLSWIPYNPDIYDYQKRGNCSRYIARCLNMDARLREITEEDVSDAFKEAQNMSTSLLAFTDHDFRDVAYDVDKLRRMIKKISEYYPDVYFKYTDAINGMRSVLNLTELIEPEFDISLKKSHHKSILNIACKNKIFGVQPFLAIKTKTNQYYWENLDFGLEPYKWYYTFDYANIDIESIDKLGVAANTITGITEVCVLDVKSQRIQKTVLNKE